MLPVISRHVTAFAENVPYLQVLSNWINFPGWENSWYFLF
jgi:hypothetical protein